MKTLYGKDKNGGFKVWQITPFGPSIIIQHGKEGGKLTRQTVPVSGKNTGRSNETTPEQQAILEAESRYKKQVDKGYRPTKEELSELPLLPMLAHDYLKQGHRIKFPCYASEKLDGVRCLAIRHKNSVQLKSRGGKDYSVEHVQDELFSVMQEGDVWDGELYIHGKYLEEITSAVKKPNDNTKDLVFVVFDVVTEDDFETRLVEVNRLQRYVLTQDGCVKTLQYTIVQDEQHMKAMHKSYVRGGYEGIMLRNPEGFYESGKRSADLQKYKEFFDEEFKIVDVTEDRNGNGVLVVWDTTANTHFDVCYGDFEERKRQLNNKEQYKGKWLTVKFQTRYKDSKLPQFPTGVCIRKCAEDGTPLE